MTITQLQEFNIKPDTWFLRGLDADHRKQADTQPKSSHAPKETATAEKEEIFFERQLGDTELSYYLPSRADGVNDMHLGLEGRFKASLIEQERVRLVWSIMRLHHPFLGSKIRMHDYEDVRFSYKLPSDSADALASADESLSFCSETAEGVFESFLNGPRTLSDNRLSYLIVNTLNSAQSLSSSSEVVQCQFSFCAVHCLGDGMALHNLANDYFILLGGDLSLAQLTKMLEDELNNQRRSMKSLPNCVEDRLPPISNGAFQRAAKRVDYLRNQQRDIGGQVFPRKSGSPRKSAVHHKAFDPERTKAILKKCKSHGVSVSSAMFTACTFAWARTSNNSPELPTLMYSALNVRPNLVKEAALHDSYWFLSLGYFNVVLPSFVPASQDLAPIFWHRTREAKRQSNAAMKTPMLTSRCRQMARERSERAQMWARLDDGKPAKQIKEPPALFGEASEQPPSKALMGLSLLGNLDAMYKHSAYPGIRLDSLTSGSRQREGAMLFFGFTFAGRLWLTLNYDENGFEKEVVEKFWRNVLQVVDGYML